MDPVRNVLSRAWTALRKEEGEERWLFSAPLGGCRSLAYGRLHSIHDANLDIGMPFLTRVREHSPGEANTAAPDARFANFRIVAGGRAQGQLCLCAPSEAEQWAKTNNRFRTPGQFWESQATLACGRELRVARQVQPRAHDHLGRKSTEHSPLAGLSLLPWFAYVAF